MIIVGRVLLTPTDLNVKTDSGYRNSDVYIRN